MPALPKIRVHELAKELGLSSKQVLGVAQDLGLEVNAASSSLGPGDVSRIQTACTAVAPRPDPRLMPFMTDSLEQDRTEEAIRGAGPLSTLTAELLGRWPQVGETAAQIHVVAWTAELSAEPHDVVAWWDAGYRYDALDDVRKLRRAGIDAPTLLDTKIAHSTVRKLLHRGEPPHYLARLLRDAGLI